MNVATWSPMSAIRRPSLAYLAGGLGIALAARAVARWARVYDLHDKVTLITGGSRGLGLVLARELLDRGARVAICARDPEELHRAHAELAERGPVLAMPCDVTDRAQVDRLVDRIRAALGPIEVLVNNAGIMEVGPMETMTVADYERAMAVHLWGPVQITLAVLPEMRLRGSGRIANIASIGGRLAVPHLLPYTVSKFALVGWSEGLRAELAPHNIAVTTVIPGLMRTGSVPHVQFKGRQREEHAWFAIAASLPVASMGAERAARRIAEAIEHGDPEVVLSMQARLALLARAVAPRLTQRMLAAVGRALPRPGGAGETPAEGRDLEDDDLEGSPWTRPTARAARRNNEL
ncbi:MAG: SDR family NAD(P)-dependent oxidoreductase [Deltaproteobacteria bacterium]|nr:SDR family NAD(P)-dependent oxidoreductase [Deltaproteobacteria bacterium]MCW5807794.1 SDR family NAD(P)-dependent oxidoreductase [Deltaproteobacteria bacterium]